MDVLVCSVQEIFSGQHRFVVPAYQRACVWTAELQWFWGDVDQVTDSGPRTEDHPHGLGAIASRREKTPVVGITEWSVIEASNP